jgi:hypothetical protein
MPGSNTAPPKEAAALFQMTMGLVVSQSLYVAADLGIADHLANGSLTAQDLAGRSGSHPDALARLLRALVALGITKLEGEDLFALTPTGELLRSDVPGSIRATGRSIRRGGCPILIIGSGIPTCRRSMTRRWKA